MSFQVFSLQGPPEDAEWMEYGQPHETEAIANAVRDEIARKYPRAKPYVERVGSPSIEGVEQPPE